MYLLIFTGSEWQWGIQSPPAQFGATVKAGLLVVLTPKTHT